MFFMNMVKNAPAARLRARLARLSAVLEVAAAKGQGLANCARRASALLDRLLTISENPPADYVAWFETTARTFTLYLTPLDIAVPFRQCTANGKKAWIFTSATLAINKSFAHFQSQLGLEGTLPGELRRILYNRELEAELLRRFEVGKCPGLHHAEVPVSGILHP